MTLVRALVVEDDEHALVTLRRILQRAGYDVKCEKTGASTAVAAATWRPAVIVLDRRLPDGDGLALVDTLRSAAPGARIIMLSGEPLDAGERALADAALLKPPSVRELLDAVRGPQD